MKRSDLRDSHDTSPRTARNRRLPRMLGDRTAADLANALPLMPVICCPMAREKRPTLIVLHQHSSLHSAGTVSMSATRLSSTGSNGSPGVCLAMVVKELVRSSTSRCSSAVSSSIRSPTAASFRSAVTFGCDFRPPPTSLRQIRAGGRLKSGNSVRIPSLKMRPADNSRCCRISRA
jgi:hypothetical protein